MCIFIYIYVYIYMYIYRELPVSARVTRPRILGIPTISFQSKTVLSNLVAAEPPSPKNLIHNTKETYTQNKRDL